MKTCPNCHNEYPNDSDRCPLCAENPSDVLPATSEGYVPPTYQSSIPPKDLKVKIVKTTHDDYGESRIAYLNISSIVVAVIVAAFVYLLLQPLLSNMLGYEYGSPEFISLLISIGCGSLIYLFLSCFVYLYSNIAIIARNSQTQATHNEHQTELLGQLAANQTQLLSNLNTVNTTVAELCSEYKGNKDTMDKQAAVLADISTAQSTIVAAQGETTTQLRELHTALGTLTSHSTSAAESAESFRSKVLSIISECRAAFEAIPARIDTLLAVPTGVDGGTEE